MREEKNILLIIYITHFINKIIILQRKKSLIEIRFAYLRAKVSPQFLCQDLLELKAKKLEVF